MQKKIQFKMAKLNEVRSEIDALDFFYIYTSVCCCYDGDDWSCFKNLTEIRIAARESQ